jgi:predicted nucleotidyltransferase
VTFAENPLRELQQALGVHWSNLNAARDLATATRIQLRKSLEQFDAADTAIVVSGSLARNEFTPGSDIDWSLLIDGWADTRHNQLVAQIGSVVKSLGAKSPGPEGTFGAMVFSHDLIHDLGGEGDTNRNTTRRVLLLLESAAIGRDDAYQRVLRSVLSRYLLEDRGFWRGSQFRVPRFLQNDFARFWRTMAVDFAYKMRARAGKGWAIRNLKLRMSRKLIYVSGLLACFHCHFDYTPENWKSAQGSLDGQKLVVEYFTRVFQQTPIEITAGAFLRFPHLSFAAERIFGAYDEFLAVLTDDDNRRHLQMLTEEEAEHDEVYRGARELTHAFRDGLLRLFFDQQSGMAELTRNYGVF